VLLGSSVAVAAVHAGWRGLAAGVIASAVDALRQHGATEITAWLGPCIRPRCYEFGADDLEDVVAALGPDVRSETAWGTPALDVAAGVRSALLAAGVTTMHDSGVCTACSPVHFSHRARRDVGRQASLIWLEP
jgi:copper oxidase (laccase) domain-containing protein